MVPIEPEDEPHGGAHPVCTFAPALHLNSGLCAKEEDCRNDEDCCTEEIYTELCTDQSHISHHVSGTQEPPAQVTIPPTSGCEIQSGAKISWISSDTLPIRERDADGDPSRCKTRCKDEQTGAKIAAIYPADCIPLPGVKAQAMPCLWTDTDIVDDAGDEGPASARTA